MSNKELKQTLIDLKLEIFTLKSEVTSLANKNQQLENTIIQMRTRTEEDVPKIKRYLEYLSNEINTNYNLNDLKDTHGDVIFKLAKSIDMVVKYYAMDIVNMEEYEKAKVNLNDINGNIQYASNITRYNSFY